MGKKAGKQAVQSSSERPRTTSSLSQPAVVDGANLVTRFSPSGRLFAQCSVAVDADSVRVFEVHSGQCVGRWASASAAERVSSLEWAELPSSSSSDEKTAPRGRKRRKGVNGEHDEDKSGEKGLETTAASSAQDAPSTSASAGEASALVEVLALGLKSSSILLLHPTQSTVIQTLSHASVISPPVSLSCPSLANLNAPSYLWSCTSTGQLSVWVLPRLSGTKGKLVAQYDTQCASCSQVAVRYISSKVQQRNGDHEGEANSVTQAITVQVLVGQFSIKLFETPLPTPKQGASDAFERPRIHLRSECSGHASAISQLAWVDRQSSASNSSASQAHFISIAKGDRFISLWSAPTASSAEEPATGILIATLGLDEEPRRIAIATNNDVICSVSSDAARIISLEAAFIPSSSQQTSTTEPPANKHRRRKHSDVRALKILSTITSSQASVPCSDAYLPSSPANAVIVAAGVLKPSLELLTYRDEAGSYIPTLETVHKQHGGLTGVNGHTSAEALRAAYSEPRLASVSSAEAARDPSVAFAPSTQVVDPAAEPTIAERLKDLHVRDGRGDDMVDDPTQRKPRRGGGRNGASKNRIADAMSTSQSLVQALHSADVRLLETCLAEKNVKVIRATVRRVPSTLVLPLVEALVERLSRTRNGTGEGTGGVDASRGQVLIEWLRNVLVVHLGYLITLPSLVERLSALHATLESRMSFHSQLLALSGRLDLVVSQIDIRANPIQDAVVSQKTTPARSFNKPNAIPVKKYVEGEESDSSSSSDGEDEEADAIKNGLMAVEPAEEGDEEDIEDLIMANGDLSGDDIDDDEDEEVDSEEEEDIPALRKTKTKSKPKVNGFLDIEAEESENEGSDEDGLPIKSRSSGVKLNGVIHEDSLDEDEDDLDRYESDFINDDSEGDESESGEEDDE